MQGSQQTGDLFNAAAQQALALAARQRGQTLTVSVEIERVFDLFRKEVAFIRQKAATAMENRERPCRRQQAFAQAMSVNPRAQRRCPAQQRSPRVGPALDAKAL